MDESHLAPDLDGVRPCRGPARGRPQRHGLGHPGTPHIGAGLHELGFRIRVQFQVWKEGEMEQGIPPSGAVLHPPLQLLQCSATHAAPIAPVPLS